MNSTVLKIAGLKNTGKTRFWSSQQDIFADEIIKKETSADLFACMTSWLKQNKFCASKAVFQLLFG